MKTSTTRSPRKAKGHGAERREEILDAALTLFSERGVHAVSTRQIAELAGISQPALYAYFTTKDDMAAELCVRAFATLIERMTAARVGHVPTAENFERALRVYVDFGVENLFDKFYYLPLGGAYVGQGTTMTANPVGAVPRWGNAVPGMGRSIYAGVNVRF